MTPRNPQAATTGHNDPTHGSPAPQDAPEPDGGPHWELRTDKWGNLVATLTGTYPPLSVTAPDLEALRKQIRTIITRAML
jgi:hypothetical protein